MRTHTLSLGFVFLKNIAPVLNTGEHSPLSDPRNEPNALYAASYKPFGASRAQSTQ